MHVLYLEINKKHEKINKVFCILFTIIIYIVLNAYIKQKSKKVVPYPLNEWFHGLCILGSAASRVSKSKANIFINFH